MTKYRSPIFPDANGLKTEPEKVDAIVLPGDPKPEPAPEPRVAAPSASRSDISLDTIVNMLTDLTTRQAMFEHRINDRLDGRQAARQQQQSARKRIAPEIVYGRDGEALCRRIDDSVNPFDLPIEFVETTRAEGYDLEWKAEMVHGQDRLTYMAKMHMNGWRPIANKRLPGLYAKEGDEGAVRYDGMVLMERPMKLTLEARYEEQRKARSQLEIKHESWGISSKDPQVFDPNTAMARQFTIKPHGQVEKSDPSWQPKLEIATADE